MSYGRVLIVEGSQKHARLIADAVNALAFPHPMHVTRGEEAVSWLGTHSCDICVLDYDLPGMNGLDTLYRIHERKPDLPVIMTSSAHSEEVAIAAFHAGVVDYVPKKRGYHDVVGDLISQLEQRKLRERIRGRADGTGDALAEQDAAHLRLVPSRGPVPGDVPDQLLAPTLQNRLRVIGRQLDVYQYRHVNLSQVVDGFHVRAVAPNSRTPQALVFAERDLGPMITKAIAMRGEGQRAQTNPPLLPTGYEDFLRALGWRLDARKAEAITVTEFGDFVAVTGVALLDIHGQPALGPFQEILRPDDIAGLLDEAFYRRSASRGGRFARLLGR